LRKKKGGKREDRGARDRVECDVAERKGEILPSLQ